MKRPALFAALALAATCTYAQPVAKLEVVKTKALTQHEKLDQLLAGQQRLEQKLDALKGSPAAPPPPVVQQPPVVPPAPPPTPPTPAANNPFVAWCAAGNNIQQYILLRNGGIGLSPAQNEQARAAGCFAPPPTPADPPAGAPQSNSGWDLGVGGGMVLTNPVAAGVAYTYTFTVSPGNPVSLLTAFGAPGQFFTRVAARITNAAGAVVLDMPDGPARYVTELELHDAAPGRYRMTITVNGSGTLGVQFQQRAR